MVAYKKNRSRRHIESQINTTLWFSLVLPFLVFSAVVPGLSQDFDSLESDITHGNSEAKRNALFQIKNLRSETASKLAVPALRDVDRMVRATAAAAVVFLPRPEAAQVLIPLLNDKDPFVRVETAFALGEAGDPSAVSSLSESLRNDAAIAVRSACAVALGGIGDLFAVDALTAVLKKKPTENSEFLRRSAAHSIGQIAAGSDSDKKMNFVSAFRNATAMLAAVLTDKKETDDTRRESAFSLGAIGDESSVSMLRSMLNSPDYYLAKICEGAIFKIEHPE